LVNDYDEIAVNLTKAADFYILPVFNPDGYVHTWQDGDDKESREQKRLWRKTRSESHY